LAAMMKDIPATENSLVLRTDYSSDSEWELVCREIQEPVGPDEFTAYIDCVSDREFDGLDIPTAVALARKNPNRYFMLVVDEKMILNPGHLILVVDLVDEPGRSFRAIPSSIQSIENNLSIANMDFFEFAENIGPDGIFRGFAD
jgi:hypothetical protein